MYSHINIYIYASYMTRIISRSATDPKGACSDADGMDNGAPGQTPRDAPRKRGRCSPALTKSLPEKTMVYYVMYIYSICVYICAIYVCICNVYIYIYTYIYVCVPFMYRYGVYNIYVIIYIYIYTYHT